MKVKTSDAARELGIDPAHLFQHLVDLAPDLDFSDVWPEIDEAWVQTLAAQEHRAPARGGTVTENVLVTKERASLCGLSEHAVRVLDKLSRQGKWGDVSVAFEALSNLTHLPNRDLERAVAELRKRGLLDHDGTGRGTISLDPARKTEIEAATRGAP